MNHIDFLPESYRQLQKRRVRLARQIVLLGIVGGSFAIAGVALKTHSIGQLRTAERLEDTVNTEQGALGVLAMLKREREELVRQVQLKRELMPAVSYTQVIASIIERQPADVTVDELMLRSVLPAPQPIETPAQLAARQKREKASSSKSTPPHLIGVEIKAIAADDLSIARFVSSLDEHPLFSQVTMRTSRPTLREQVEAREFSLTAVVDLNRRFQWTPSATEVADAN